MDQGAFLSSFVWLVPEAPLCLLPRCGDGDSLDDPTPSWGMRRDSGQQQMSFLVRSWDKMCPMPLANVERNLSSDDLGLQPLNPERDALFTPPRTPPQNEGRRRSAAKATVDNPIEAKKRRPWHRTRASSDVTWARKIPPAERKQSIQDANSSAQAKNATIAARPPLSRTTSKSSVHDVASTTSHSHFKDPFTSPKELLLRRNPFSKELQNDRPSEDEYSSETSEAHAGNSEAYSPTNSRRSSFGTHTIVPNYEIRLTEDEIKRLEEDTRRSEAARLREKEEDLGAQVIPEEKTPVVPDFALEYPPIAEPKDPARILNKGDLRKQRTFFFSIVIVLNMGALMAAVFAGGTWVFVFILFIKSKDCLSAICSAVGLAIKGVYRLFVPRKPVDSKWILTLIPAYSESEEQIVKTIFSLRDNDVEPHRQVMCVILDGKNRNVKKHMTREIASFKRPYVTVNFKKGELVIDVGFMENVPVICIEKVKNSGKKDSLILCHDLFNVMRENAPLYTKTLRKEIWTTLLPTLTGLDDFKAFDMVFCTDADSTIYKGAVASLANAIARKRNAIAACGLVLVELEEGYKWSRWNLYQQFQVSLVRSRYHGKPNSMQYTFGQYVRRRAEGLYGKVTCLPGCITMIAVRPEMAGAIRKYAEPITAYPVILHQVQYLGTDRRLTYSMLSQDRKLKTLFVPEAVSETVAPQSLQHYLSQRRRWGSNAYFNNYFYCFGEKMTPLMRLAASVELVRLTMVYYRIANTIMFVYSLTQALDIMRIIPLLIVSQLPTVWFAFCVIFVERELQRRSFKLLLGFLINKVLSPFLAVTVFTKVAKNLGSQGKPSPSILTGDGVLTPTQYGVSQVEQTQQ